MAYDVSVKIDLTKPVGKLGFGIPLLLVENATNAVEYAEVSNIAEVVEVGFEATSDIYKAAALLFDQKNAPKQIAVCAVTTTAVVALQDQKLTGKGWRQLIVINGGETASALTELATAVEALKDKMLFVNLDADDATEITLGDKDHTVLFYCNKTEDVPVPVAALVGEAAGQEVGSFTYKNLILSGIEPQDLTDLQVEAIHKKGGITFVTKAGDNVTSEGKTVGGEYIDIIDSEDYIIQQLTYKTQKMLNNAAKVAYTNNGIAMLESVAVDVLQGAFNSGMIATKADGSADYSVSYALREDTKAEDRAARIYPYGTFKFALAGAIHHVEITGTITA